MICRACSRQPTRADPTMPAPKTTHVDPLATFAVFSAAAIRRKPAGEQART